jgi:integrase/recombinase XerD
MVESAAVLCCPECGSKGPFYRDGLRVLSDGSTAQRWLCRSCFYRFSEAKVKLNVASQVLEVSDSGKDIHKVRIASNSGPRQEVSDRFPLFLSEDIRSHGTSNLFIIEKQLSALPNYNRYANVCAQTKGAKNMDTATIKKVAGETTQHGTILEYAWKLKKRNLSDNTIKIRTFLLNQLVKKGSALDNPDSVETLLATEQLTASHKSKLVAEYSSYTKTMGIQWEPIKVKYRPREPFLPLETELDQIIAACGKKTAAYLQLLKDTGARSGEASKVRWTDMNEANITISINDAEKGSDTRTVKVTPKTIAMLKALPNKYDPYIFNPRSLSMKEGFQVARKRLAATLHNPRFKQIHLHTFRHWKATMEYHKTKDLLHVMKMLGHRNIQSTLVYTRLINFESDEYHAATAKTLEDAKQLIESGFEYVCDMEDYKLFRKRK